MAEYRIYCIDEENHIVERSEYHLPDDLTALEKARALCGQYEIEIWEAARRVARLAKNGTASLRPDSEARV